MSYLTRGVLALFLSSSLASAAEINIGVYGGDNAKAQQQAWHNSWSQESGHIANAVMLGGRLEPIREQVANGRSNYHVVELNSVDTAKACDSGLLERLSFANMGFNSQVLLKGAVNACGVGFLVFSNVLAYSPKYVKNPPKSWADFWDVNKYPGKRALRKTALYSLEFALMADGVEAKDVYTVLMTKEGQDRAFAKLSQLKPNIVWWRDENIPNILQRLSTGEIAMTSMFNGRIGKDLKARGVNFTWQDAIYDMDYWAIPKGVNNQEAAQSFIKFSLQPQNQRVFIGLIDYGPSNRLAMDLVTEEEKEALPTAPENIVQQLAVNEFFWADYGEQLERRFEQWVK